MKKNTKRVLKSLGIAGLAATATYFTIGNVFYFFTLTKKGLESEISDKMGGKVEKGKELKKHLDSIMDTGKEWFDAADKEKLAIRSSHSKKILHADYLFSDRPSDVCVILIHGYTSSPRSMGIYAKRYHEEGYDVLSPSLNGHADSEEKTVTMGWNDRLDVIDWINYITESYPDKKIIIHGVSMGAATAMMTTGEELPDNVKAAVADCGYTSVWDIFSNKLHTGMNLPDFPVLYCANTVNKAISHYDFKKASSVEQLKKSKTPTIFLHGDSDTFVPYEMLDEVYNACAAEKHKVIIPDAPHARNACIAPELYWSEIFAFIKKYI